MLEVLQGQLVFLKPNKQHKFLITPCLQVVVTRLTAGFWSVLTPTPPVTGVLKQTSFYLKSAGVEIVVGSQQFCDVSKLCLCHLWLFVLAN